MRSNNMWRRFFAMAAAVVFAVAAMVPAAAMADVVDDLASTSPVHEKTLEDNGDGTYDLTLSVSGDAEQTDKVKPVDIVLVVDVSTSMNQKIDGIGSKTRMQAAHDAAAALAKELLTAENANLSPDQQTRISVVTFGNKAYLEQGYSTNAEDISNAVPTKAKYFKGTNWEAALILANEQLGRANAEKHVIFLSDGDPTLRMSAEGYGAGIELHPADGKNPDGTYGTYVNDPKGRNLSAATKVATKRPASSMYVVNTSKSAEKMGIFAEKTGGSLLDGTTENNLAAAFSQIGQVIRKSVSYQDVALTDQLSSWVEFVSADNGSVGNIRYTKNGNDWIGAPPAKIDEDTLTWNLGTLDKGTTYSVTFTIRPNAQAKADVASKGVDTGYATNNADTSGVAYKTVVKTLEEGDKVSGLQKSPFEEKPIITLTAPAAATATLSGTKTLEGRTLEDGEFKFRISVAEGSDENTPLPDETSVTNAADGSITFGTITFSKTGTYLYDVVEDTSVLPEGVSAVTRDPQRVEVKVTLGDDGALEAETVGELKFVNTYSAKPASVSLKATKVLKGA